MTGMTPDTKPEGLDLTVNQKTGIFPQKFVWIIIWPMCYEIHRIQITILP
jgi:hypothetical protein